jgi:beta-lactamase regulating signal transducer with metallopeptidase domain
MNIPFTGKKYVFFSNRAYIVIPKICDKEFKSQMYKEIVLHHEPRTKTADSIIGIGIDIIPSL